MIDLLNLLHVSIYENNLKKIQACIEITPLEGERVILDSLSREYLKLKFVKSATEKRIGEVGKEGIEEIKTIIECYENTIKLLVDKK